MAKYPGHGWGNAPVQPDPQHLTLGPVGAPWQRCRLYPGRAYKRPPRNSGKVTFVECGKKVWVYPGGVARNANYPRRTWRLDAGDGVEGVGVTGWRRVVELDSLLIFMVNY
jgi:hypothetical protein